MQGGSQILHCHPYLHVHLTVYSSRHLRSTGRHILCGFRLFSTGSHAHHVKMQTAKQRTEVGSSLAFCYGRACHVELLTLTEMSSSSDSANIVAMKPAERPIKVGCKLFRMSSHCLSRHISHSISPIDVACPTGWLVSCVLHFREGLALHLLQK